MKQKKCKISRKIFTKGRLDIFKNKLQIGCGRDKKKGFMNIDCAKAVNPDSVEDIEQGMSFKENSFDYIYSRMTLEHIRPFYWRFVLDEIYRVAKPNCIIELILPYDNKGERTSGDHYRTFNFRTFDTFSPTISYYVKLKIERINKISLLQQILWYLTPFIRHDLHFIFRVVKQDKNNQEIPPSKEIKKWIKTYAK